MGLAKEPPGWAQNKHIFDDWDVTDEEEFLASQIDFGARRAPRNWDRATRRKKE
jgi:hypothetical protein